MAQPVISTPANGVTFLSVDDDRFTTARLTVSFYLPLTEKTAGAYAMLPFLLRRGCRAFPDMTTFNRELDRLYGAHVSASVSRSGETQMLTLAMTSLDDRFALNGETVSARCAQLMLSLLFDPPLENGVFRAEDVEQERRCALEIIAAQINDKRRYAQMQCERLLCGNEPYAVSCYGTKETVGALTAAELTEAWRSMLKKAPMQIIYQGCGDAHKVAQAFAARLTDRTPDVLPPVVTAEAKKAVVEQVEKMDVNQCQLVFGFRTQVQGTHPLTDAMRLACAILGGTPHSLLFLNVREKNSLCYYCFSGYDRQKGVLLIDSGVEENMLSRAREEIMKQLFALKNGEFDEEALENARLSVLDSLMAAQDSAYATAGWYSAQGNGSVLRSPEQVAQAVRAVTRQQVLDAAATIVPDCAYMLTPTEKED